MEILQIISWIAPLGRAASRTSTPARCDAAAIHIGQIAKKRAEFSARQAHVAHSIRWARGKAPASILARSLAKARERRADALGVAFGRLRLKRRLAWAIERPRDAPRQHVLAHIPSHAPPCAAAYRARAKSRLRLMRAMLSRPAALSMGWDVTLWRACGDSLWAGFPAARAKAVMRRMRPDIWSRPSGRVRPRAEASPSARFRDRLKSDDATKQRALFRHQPIGACLRQPIELGHVLRRELHAIGHAALRLA